MTQVRTTFSLANGGTLGSAPTTSTEPLFAGGTVTATGGTQVYDNTNLVNGQSTNLKVTPSGSGIRVTRNVSISTREMSAQFTFRAPTTGGSGPIWGGVGLTRVWNVGFTSANKFTFVDAAPTTLWTSTLTWTPGADYEIDVYVKLHATTASLGLAKVQIRLAGSATVLDSYNSTLSTNANLGTTTLTSIAFIAAITSSTLTTFYPHSASWDTAATNYLSPWYITSSVGPLGTIAHIGDSTSSQDGNGAVNVPARYVLGGWLAGDINFYGVGSKRIDAPDANGKTTIQNIQDARAALSQEPAVWVIALGTNYRFEADSQTLIEVTDVMNEINSIGSPGKVLWVGISQSTAGGGLDANSIRRNAYIASLAGTTFPTMTWVDLDAYIRNGRDERDIWFDPPDANFAHMSVGGYILRNAYIATQARKVVTGLPNVILDLNGSGSLVGDAPYYSASPALSGSGSLGVAVVPGFPKAVALSGSGALGTVGVPGVSVAPALSGSGALGVTRTFNIPITPQLSGSGALGTSATPAFPVAVALGGSGTLIAGTGPGAAPQLTGSGSLGVVTTITTVGTATLSGSGSLSAVPVVGFARTAALTGSGALSASVTPRPAQSVSLTGAGSLAASGAAVAKQTPILTGAGSLGTSAVPRMAIVAALAGSGALTAFSGAPPFNVGSYNYTALREREYHGYIPPRSD